MSDYNDAPGGMPGFAGAEQGGQGQDQGQEQESSLPTLLQPIQAPTREELETLLGQAQGDDGGQDGQDDGQQQAPQFEPNSWLTDPNTGYLYHVDEDGQPVLWEGDLSIFEDPAQGQEVPARATGTPGSAPQEQQGQSQGSGIPAALFTQQEQAYFEQLAVTNPLEVQAEITRRVMRQEMAGNSAMWAGAPLPQEFMQAYGPSIERYSMDVPPHQRGTREARNYAVMAAVSEDALRSGDPVAAMKKALSALERSQEAAPLPPARLRPGMAGKPAGRQQQAPVRPGPPFMGGAGTGRPVGRTAASPGSPANSPSRELAESLGLDSEERAALMRGMNEQRGGRGRNGR